MVKKTCKKCGKEYDVNAYDIPFDEGFCDACSVNELQDFYKVFKQ
ncbi:hypothetical protein LCGC14_2069050 [marine sediment metagenome]|uniref:Uncharacterized protein n=1 Tax=marine sediment metagenome TaxID=412755 RepID=A0A0F9EIU6_9ZZZZ